MSSKKALEKRAKDLLGYLKSELRYDPDFLPKPFMAEVTGTPSSGKTTTITEFDKFFRRMGFERVWKPQEGAEVIRHIPRSTPRYNVRTGIYALQNLLDESHGHKYDLVIFDRAVFDSYCWMKYWYRKGKLSESERSTNQSFFLQNLWTGYIDVCFMMVCDSEEAMRRELKLAVSDKLGETTNPKTLDLLMEIWQESYLELKTRFPQIQMINTTKMTEQEMIETVTIKALNAFEERIKQKIAR